MNGTSWVRLFAGQRSRTPIRPRSPSSHSPTALIVDNSVFGSVIPPSALSETPRHPSPHLSSLRTPTPLDQPVTGSDLLVNEGNRMQHNRSVDDMAEALRIAIMTKRAIATLGPEYTSYVLHLIEGFENVKKALVDMETALDEANTERDRDGEIFMNLAQGWDEQQELYKAEIKRLELVIQDISTQGVGRVVVARAGSLVRRKKSEGNESSKGMNDGEAGLGDEDDDSSSDSKEDNVENRGQVQCGYHSILNRRRILDPMNDVRVSEQLRRQARLDLALAADDNHHELSEHQLRPRPAMEYSATHSASCSPPSLFFSSESHAPPSSQGSLDPPPSYSASTAMPHVEDVDDQHSACAMGTEGDLDESVAHEYENATPSPTAVPTSAGRGNHHRREFSFAPGDDRLGMVPTRKPMEAAPDGK